MLKKGIYEQVINDSLFESLDNEKDVLKPVIESIDSEEAPRILGSYIGELTQKTLTAMHESNHTEEAAINMINQLVDILSSYSGKSVSSTDYIHENKAQKADMLYGIEEKNSLSERHLVRPETSIARSSLFTGAANEPKLYSEFKNEIISADRIDMLVSFIKWSGIRLILDELRDFTQRGGKLYVITTTYMGASDAKAIDELSQLPNTEIKISYDTKRTRLHAKTYVFYRNTGFTTAYIGSSNLSNPAMSDGLEWNMKITRKDLPETFRKIEASFNSYWHMPEFETYDHSEQNLQVLDNRLHDERDHKTSDLTKITYQFHIEPYSYQKEILEQLQAERQLHNSFRNLLVAATGTGKTVIAAFDYKRFVKAHPNQKNRLLFIAHREEILKQSIACFRGVLGDQNFGDLLVGDYRPLQFDHLFVSIASFGSHHFIEKTSPDYFDFIIVDESHHDAADSYHNLMEYYTPKILLGMTATPERLDGKSILPYFNNRIAAEIRLPEAIDRKLLAPFQYFVITDAVDLNNISWKNGSYVRKDLENAYIGDPYTAQKRADTVIKAIARYGMELRDIKGLGFCVTIDHAEYMAEEFNKSGISSLALSSKSSQKQREDAAKQLKDGDLHFIFVVDLYNEGVDIPQINTILFLRPTESLTVFLQQLGRGLRLADGKDYLTVLDFVGQANANYDFESRFTALLENTHRNIVDEIKKGFLFLPKGCSITMEKIARETILRNIENAYKGSLKNRVIRKLKTFESDWGEQPSLENFLNHNKLDMRDLYASFTFNCCKAEAGLFNGYREETFMKMKDQAHALRRVASIDSRRWINYLLKLLSSDNLPPLPGRDTAEFRMLQMFQFTIWNKSYQDCGFETPMDNLRIIRNNIWFCNELVELLEYRLKKIDFIDEPVDLGFDCPLDLHCLYTRDQILLAMDDEKPHDMREGVKWIKAKKTDILLITLNKADKDYSPTTLYKDYSINDHLFHWQSQSTTSPESSTGQRYINHADHGSNVLLFVRLYKTRNNRPANESEPYVFLGKAQFESSEGTKPMNIIWRLERPIPGKYLSKTNIMIED